MQCYGYDSYMIRTPKLCQDSFLDHDFKRSLQLMVKLNQNQIEKSQTINKHFAGTQ